MNVVTARLLLGRYWLEGQLSRPHRYLLRRYRNRLRSQGRCWRKTGFASGAQYCGTHGRDAGWPCQGMTSHVVD